MLSNIVLPVLLSLSLSNALPVGIPSAVVTREVPQEHSHNAQLDAVRVLLQTNNPAGIVDPVFGLLGDAAAAGGKGTITDVSCLQQATADQAFTNAKAAKDITGMTNALIYRALERNTGKVGLASNPCTSIKAVNPEIAAISQHQDPASANAAATNKAIVLALATQISSIGGNPQDALKSGTFAPGSLADNTGKGLTCDTAGDTAGCIFSQNLLVPDATAAEIAAAAGGAVTPTAPAPVAPAAPTASVTTCSGAPVVAPPAAPSASATPPAAGALDLGTCPEAGIIFGVGFDGRKEASFEPANQVQITHGSAQRIGVITQFIIDRFNDRCGANAAAKAAALAAQTAALALTGQAAADAWNSGLGLTNVVLSTTP